MIDFAKVEESVKELKSQVDSGEIDQEAFESNLVDMIDYADDGYYWMFGYKTGNWYRHDGKDWIPDNPERLKKLSHNHDNAATSSPQSLADRWKTVSWGWFIAALIVLLLISWIIFNSV